MWISGRLLVAVIFVSVGIIPTSSRAQSIEAVLRQYRLTGSPWSVDCNKPRGPGNWYGTYTATGGTAKLVYDNGKTKNVYKIVSARALSSTDLLMTQEFLSQFHEILIRVEGDHYKTLSSKLPDGRFKVKDGTFADLTESAGQKSPVLDRCQH